jgi:hypothetical protein
MNVVTRAGPRFIEPGTWRGDCGMGVELRQDWNVDVRPVAEGGAVRTMPHAAPATKINRAGKLLVVALAAAITLGWTAFLCSLIARFAGSLF